MNMDRCTCNPARTFTWVDEECPAHGREAQEQREAEEYSDAEIGGLGSGPRYPVPPVCPCGHPKAVHWGDPVSCHCGCRDYREEWRP